jgi:hypothetical protein
MMHYINSAVIQEREMNYRILASQLENAIRINRSNPICRKEVREAILRLRQIRGLIELKETQA